MFTFHPDLNKEERTRRKVLAEDYLKKKIADFFQNSIGIRHGTVSSKESMCHVIANSKIIGR